mgnify:FL=1
MGQTTRIPSPPSSPVGADLLQDKFIVEWVAHPFDGSVVDIGDRPISVKRQHRLKVLRAQSYHCWYCGWFVDLLQAHLDHQSPKVQGGKANRRNLVASCPSCNLRKGPRSVDEYRRYVNPPGGKFWGER